jgi:hypothetical protein
MLWLGVVSFHAVVSFMRLFCSIDFKTNGVPPRVGIGFQINVQNSELVPNWRNLLLWKSDPNEAGKRFNGQVTYRNGLTGAE